MSIFGFNHVLPQSKCDLIVFTLSFKYMHCISLHQEEIWSRNSLEANGRTEHCRISMDVLFFTFLSFRWLKKNKFWEHYSKWPQVAHILFIIVHYRNWPHRSVQIFCNTSEQLCAYDTISPWRNHLNVQILDDIATINRRYIHGMFCSDGKSLGNKCCHTQ